MMVTGRSSGTSFRTGVPSSATDLTPTFTSANPGIYLDTGSESESLPASINIIAATLVMGFVIEWSAKIVSGVIGALVATSRTPKHFR
jgi:hypothetical protein